MFVWWIFRTLVEFAELQKKGLTFKYYDGVKNEPQ
jgi:hypothetical protein